MLIENYKKSRIVNININIIVAGLLATALAAYPIHLTKAFTDVKIIIVAFAIAIDTVFDLMIFITLHLVVNTRSFKKGLTKINFTKDIFRIQLQRGIFSAGHYLVAGGTFYFLLSFGIERTIGFLISNIVAIAFSRTLHIIYGLKTGLFKPLN